jgi:phage tail tape-measure protein
METSNKSTGTNANRDPISGTPGAHPIGTGVGAALGGAAAGAATGTVAGPVGTVVGAAIGAVVGGLAGKGVAESIDPTREDAYWRENYKSRPYVSDASYDDFGPAYAYGVSSYSMHAGHGHDFGDIESDLGRNWDKVRGTSSLSWERAKNATRDAWNRVAH